MGLVPWLEWDPSTHMSALIEVKVHERKGTRERQNEHKEKQRVGKPTGEPNRGVGVENVRVYQLNLAFSVS